MGGGNDMKTRSKIRIPMPARYVINLALVVGFYFLLTGLISSGIITNYWTGILITVGINIILEMCIRDSGKDAHAMTITLLMNSEGKKMGKTAKGAVWLDPNKTTPFEFYQYWRNVGDADVLKCIRMLTFLPLEQIDEMDKLSLIHIFGDGALTGGLSYEGLNNAGASREPLIVILNDNGMSITPRCV